MKFAFQFYMLKHPAQTAFSKLFFLAVVGIVSACGSSSSSPEDDIKDGRSSGSQADPLEWRDLKMGLASGFIDVPSDSDSQVIARSEIPSGSWLLSRVKSQMNFFDFEIVMRFDHQLDIPGYPDSSDAYFHSADWGRYDPVEEGDVSVFIEHNLALQVQGGGDTPNFTDRFYYFTEERSDGDWQWWIDDQASEGGSKVFEFLKSGNLVENKTYEATLSNNQLFGRALATLQGDRLKIYTVFRINSRSLAFPQITVLYEYEKAP